MTTQLRCRDLRAGDILLKVPDGALTKKLIQASQRLTGGANPDIVHAGLMFDSTYVIEAQRAGISANDLRVQDLPYGYYVYRCTDANIAAGAGTCAKMMFDINGRGKNLGYSLLGALKSLFGSRGSALTPEAMDALLGRILDGQGQGFFCSQFVVYVYQFVAEQNGLRAASVFDVADAKASPSTLAALLSHHRMFGEAGYLMPNER